MAFYFRIIKHADQYLCFIKIFFIMYPKIICTYTITQLYNYRFKSI